VISTAALFLRLVWLFIQFSAKISPHLKALCLYTGNKRAVALLWLFHYWNQFVQPSWSFTLHACVCPSVSTRNSSSADCSNICTKSLDYASGVSVFNRLSLGLTQPPIQWVPRVLSPGLKRGQGLTLTTQPHIVPRFWMSKSYTSSPPQAPSWHVVEQLF